MKFQLKNILAIMALALVLVSCSKDEPTVSGVGGLELEFDNVYGAANLALNTQTNTTSQGENLKISSVKYIISNIVLTKEDGTTYAYPKNQSYFIIDEADEESQMIELTNVPAGNYTKIKFGIGVDKEHFDLGETEQGSVLTMAQEAGMTGTWVWEDGYISTSFEGVFTSPTVTYETPFKIQTLKSNTVYNYTEVTLTLPEKAMVRTTITPEAHIFSDVSKIIDGVNKYKLTDKSVITDGDQLGSLMANISEMFRVAHVHND